MHQEELLFHLHRSLGRILCHPPPRRGGHVHKILLAQHNLRVPHSVVWTRTKRIFTKLIATVIVFLRRQLGILIIAYIDNLLIQAADAQTCRLHAEITILVLQDLGYGVNFGKSALTPSKTVEHLGFTWDRRQHDDGLAPAGQDR